MRPDPKLLRAAAVQTLTRAAPNFEVKPWRDIMIDSNQGSVLESKSGATVFGGTINTLTTGINTMTKMTAEEKAMSALAARASSYVKGANGQLHSGDEIAQTLASVPAGRVVSLLVTVLGLESNPYEALNYGQQSMNLRNKLRGAARKDATILETLKQVIADSDLTIPPKSDKDPLAVTE